MSIFLCVQVPVTPPDLLCHIYRKQFCKGLGLTSRWLPGILRRRILSFPRAHRYQTPAMWWYLWKSGRV